jgi:hypothetical protein
MNKSLAERQERWSIQVKEMNYAKSLRHKTFMVEHSLPHDFPPWRYATFQNVLDHISSLNEPQSQKFSNTQQITINYIHTISLIHQLFIF